jgi:hypothetical protein
MPPPDSMTAWIAEVVTCTDLDGAKLFGDDAVRVLSYLAAAPYDGVPALSEATGVAPEAARRAIVRARDFAFLTAPAELSLAPWAGVEAGVWLTKVAAAFPDVPRRAVALAIRRALIKLTDIKFPRVGRRAVKGRRSPVYAVPRAVILPH